MSTFGKTLIVAALAIAVGIIIIARHNKPLPEDTSFAENATSNRSLEAAPSAEPKTPAQKIKAAKQLPRLVDLGADKCIPCKMMAPILEELKQEYAHRMQVEFIDVWKNPNAGEKYGIRIIPTQIFFDASGKELFRHEGFFSKEDILSKWKQLGVNVD